VLGTRSAHSWSVSSHVFPTPAGKAYLSIRSTGKIGIDSRIGAPLIGSFPPIFSYFLPSSDSSPIFTRPVYLFCLSIIYKPSPPKGKRRDYLELISWVLISLSVQIRLLFSPKPTTILSFIVESLALKLESHEKVYLGQTIITRAKELCFCIKTKMRFLGKNVEGSRKSGSELNGQQIKEKCAGKNSFKSGRPILLFRLSPVILLPTKWFRGLDNT